MYGHFVLSPSFTCIKRQRLLPLENLPSQGKIGPIGDSEQSKKHQKNWKKIIRRWKIEYKFDLYETSVHWFCHYIFEIIRHVCAWHEMRSLCSLHGAATGLKPKDYGKHSDGHLERSWSKEKISCLLWFLYFLFWDDQGNSCIQQPWKTTDDQILHSLRK